MLLIMQHKRDSNPLKNYQFKRTWKINLSKAPGAPVRNKINLISGSGASQNKRKSRSVLGSLSQQSFALNSP